MWLMGRPFVMVSAEEHTAQVPGEVRNRIEQDFKSRHGRTNCLVATPTLEMGVNIGALDMALMRNVPPRPSNYWQRAGRAGREERMAVVVTYCRRSNHDRYFFDDPLRLLGGCDRGPDVQPPQPADGRQAHPLGDPLRAAPAVPGSRGRTASRSGTILNALFPTFIRSYLLDEDNHFRESPTSTAPLRRLARRRSRATLADRLVALFARHWPEEAAELADRAAIERTIDETADALDAVIKRLHRRLTWARSTRSELHKKKDAGLIEREEEQLLRRCDEFIKSIVSLRPPDLHADRPGGRGLPARLRRLRGRRSTPRPGGASPASPALGPSTCPAATSSALREFVPGNRLYANRGTFYVARYHLGADETRPHPHPAGRPREGLRHRAGRGRHLRPDRAACRSTPCR